MVKEIESYTEFQQIINSGDVVVFDFFATWCPPCKAISPDFERLAGQNTSVKFYKVNVDNQEQVSEEVSIRAMPTFMVFKDGNKVKELVGAELKALENLVTAAAALT